MYVVSGFSRTVVNVACRGSSGRAHEIRLPAMARASGPLSRTTPMPPRPGGVAIATIVSLWNMSHEAARRPLRTPGPEDSGLYFRNEMKTVFENASPTLSVVTPGTSATAICTRRRS